MHGRPRRPPKAADAASIAKAERLHSLQADFLRSRRNQIYTREALETSSKLLQINPEAYTAWNYRKIAVSRLLESKTDHDKIKSILDEELRVNPKSYGAWHRRKWVISKGFSSPDHEFKLLNEFLKVVIVIKSNLLKQEAEGHLSKEQTLAGEFELVDGAIFTDPDDQSAWFYHLWLLDETAQSDIPILTASWPPPGSNLTLAAYAELGVYVSSPYKCFFPKPADFPLLLHFNQPVEMISNSVTVKCMVLKNEDLVWRPLSTSNMVKAKSWITYLSFPDELLNNQNVYTVEVSLRQPLGVMCSETQYSSPVNRTREGLHKFCPSRPSVLCLIPSQASQNITHQVDGSQCDPLLIGHQLASEKLPPLKTQLSGSLPENLGSSSSAISYLVRADLPLQLPLFESSSTIGGGPPMPLTLSDPFSITLHPSCSCCIIVNWSPQFHQLFGLSLCKIVRSFPFGHLAPSPPHPSDVLSPSNATITSLAVTLSV
ncbi:Geranylgeranyl transferase type-2 subunit alpha [Nymphaea thermarum]|nr:Geranylgeranyl transferase type-2 subunit alpha [Nymphaea thermarum]